MEKYLVTAALPYANGSIHLGHLLEHVQADVFVRFLKLTGKDVIFVCADDTHGTPIELAAEKAKISPEELIKKYYEEHTSDLASFFINFDIYHSTNSKENKHYSDFFFSKLREKGLIFERLVELMYCESDKRYLPDRYVRGKCPKCGAEEQYGDQCEKCNSTYQPSELVNPKCSICGAVPARKQSLHYFFKLSSFSKEIKEWLDTNKNVQLDAKNFIQGWISSGLQDWDISRDGPYFGFKIPGESNKFYYVWLDAPIGYIAATEKYSQEKLGLPATSAYWCNPDAKIIHFIGKDIIYFHYLFWPAMLMATGFNLPSDIAVHGHLTINGEKMSKSRGNFLTAKDYLSTEGHEPEFLRFYYAAHLIKSVNDINLDFEEFKTVVNSDLVGNIANFVHRTIVFINNNFDSKLDSLGPEEKKFLDELKPKYDAIIKSYSEYNFREAVRGILEIGSIGNRYFQENQPWQLVKTDKKKCHRIVTAAANIVKNLMVISSPVLPKYAEKILRILGEDAEPNIETITETISDRKIYPSRIIFAPIESTLAIPESFPAILKVGKVVEIIEHPDAIKLYVLKVDIAEEKPRQIIAGLRNYYKKEELLGKLVIIVSNLKYAKLRGVESQGMMLAADSNGKVMVISPANSSPGDVVFPEGSTLGVAPSKMLEIEDFYKLSLKVKDEQIIFGTKPLKTARETISVDAEDDAVVR